MNFARPGRDRRALRDVPRVMPRLDSPRSSARAFTTTARSSAIYNGRSRSRAHG